MTTVVVSNTLLELVRIHFALWVSCLLEQTLVLTVVGAAPGSLLFQQAQLQHPFWALLLVC